MYKHHHRAIVLISVWAFLAGAEVTAVDAADFHAPPRDFFFGNHLDTHQENSLKINKGTGTTLSGFLYIIYTGDVDSVSGLPVARHPRGPGQGEECGVDVNCVPGWLVDGLPGAAKFLYHSGVNGEDHAEWLVNRAEIPGPGSFTHFHWIGSDSTDPRADDVSPECDAENAAGLEDVAVDATCAGWFLQLRAIREFAFEHGGERIPVRVGIDNTTHVNLVTNYNGDLVITPTRP